MRVLLVLLLAFVSFPALAGDEKPVDVAIVVAYDRSESIDRGEALVQIEGLIHTLRHPRFLAAIQAGYFKRIALSALSWSSFGKFELIMPWVQIGDETQADLAAIWLEKFLARGERISHGTQTDIAHGIKLATEQIHALPWQSTRKVINVVGDGVSNIGRLAVVARDEALAAGITVNGLIMARGKATRVLAEYYRREVIGGPTSFVQVSRSNEDFAAAMLRKMTLEMVRLRQLRAAEGGGKG